MDQSYKKKKKKKKKATRPTLFENFMLLQYNNFFFLALWKRLMSYFLRYFVKVNATKFYFLKSVRERFLFKMAPWDLNMLKRFWNFLIP